MDEKSIRLLREELGLSQRRVAVLSSVSQASISLMEAGKTPIDAKYVRWLQRQIYGKYKSLSSMPAPVLAYKIKHREEYVVA